MEIRRFDELGAFTARVSSHLEAREAEHNLELGILAAIAAGRYDEHAPLLVSIEDGGSVQGVAIRTPPHGLLLSSEVTRAGAEAFARWLLDLDDSVAAIPGVQGERGVAASFVDAWQRAGGAPMRVHREERIYRLTEVRSPSAPPSGAIRPIRRGDRPLLVEWFAAFAVDTGDPDPMDPEVAVDRLLEAESASLGLHLWERDGRPRSMAGHSGPTPNGIRVGPVYTPPAERRHGYAGALVAGLSQRLLDGGREFCFLFTDLANPTSNRIYQAIGYEPVCDVTQYRAVDG